MADNVAHVQVSERGERYDVLARAKKPLRLLTEEEWAVWTARLQTDPRRRQQISAVAHELGLTWPDSRASDTVESYLTKAPQDLRRMHAIGAKKCRTIVLCIAHLASASSRQHASSPAPASSPPKQSCGSIVRSMMDRLRDARERRVICARCAWPEGEAKTLADLGVELNVTRERVRQVEQRAIKRLRSSAKDLRQLAAAFWDDADRLWDGFAEGGTTVDERTPESTKLRRLSSEHRVAMAILKLDSDAVLNRIAIRSGSGWYRAGLERAAVDGLIRYLDAGVNSNFPLEVTCIAEMRQCSLQAVRIASRLSRRTTYYCGYLSKGAATTRIRRAIWTHRVLASSDSEAVPVRTLLGQYRNLELRDDCSVRDLEIILARYTHMFLPMARGEWRALGGRPLEGAGRPMPPSGDDEITSEPVDEEENLTSQLRTVLQEHGPMFISELDVAFKQQMKQRYSVAGAHAILITSSEFSRLAPGLYSLPEHHDDPSALGAARQKLLNEDSCEKYVRAMRAGEPPSAFDLWDATMEMMWREWAQRSASPTLLRSLEAIATPERWPCDMSKREGWLLRVARDAQYELDSETPMLEEFLPPVEELLPALAAARSRSVLGWVGVNRLLRRRLNDRHALIVLGLLIGLGAIAPNQDWRVGHATIADVADNLYQRLADERHVKGPLTWHSDLGAELRALLRTRRNSELGWLRGEQVATLRSDAATLSDAIADAPDLLPACVELAIAVAQSDGVVDPREVAVLRERAERFFPCVPPSTRSEVASMTKDVRTMTPDVDRLSLDLRKLGPTARVETMTFLFDVAAADGVFRPEEESALERIGSRMEVDSDSYARLYRTHRHLVSSSDDPTAGLETQSESVDDLFNVLFSPT